MPVAAAGKTGGASTGGGGGKDGAEARRIATISAGVLLLDCDPASAAGVKAGGGTGADGGGTGGIEPAAGGTGGVEAGSGDPFGFSLSLPASSVPLSTTRPVTSGGAAGGSAGRADPAPIDWMGTRTLSLTFSGPAPAASAGESEPASTEGAGAAGGFTGTGGVDFPASKGAIDIRGFFGGTTGGTGAGGVEAEGDGGGSGAGAGVAGGVDDGWAGTLSGCSFNFRRGSCWGEDSALMLRLGVAKIRPSETKKMRSRF